MRVISQNSEKIGISPHAVSTHSLAEPRLLTGREGPVQRREMFDYVIRSKRVGVRDESLSMLSSEKRLRTDYFIRSFKYFPTHNTVRITT